MGEAWHNSDGVLGVDEAQFFPDVLEWSEEMANSGKVKVKIFLSSSRESRVLLCTRFPPVFRIRRIHMFVGFLDLHPDS